MNHSIYSADRTTHLKVVIVALIAGILVAGFGIFMDEGLTTRVMKTGKSVMVTTSNKSVKLYGVDKKAAPSEGGLLGAEGWGIESRPRERDV